MCCVVFPQFNVETANGEEFYEIYKGVVNEYPSMVTEICSGPCIALEVTGKGGDTAAQFRELCGPSDPVSVFHLAKQKFYKVTQWKISSKL